VRCQRASGSGIYSLLKRNQSAASLVPWQRVRRVYSAPAAVLSEEGRSDAVAWAGEEGPDDLRQLRRHTGNIGGESPLPSRQ
jgi:hypothetical protein